MLDTVRIRSPYIDEATATRLEQHLVRRSAVELSTGSVLWEFTAGDLEGSHDSRISVQVNRQEFRSMPPLSPGGRPRAMLFPCQPYVVVEASVHKAMLGHNVTGGPYSFHEALTWFYLHLNSKLGACLPPVDEWTVDRVDWAECYHLSAKAIREYISSLNSVQYPRRKVYRYGSESIFSPGTTTAIKVYHKGPEFHSHDRKRVERELGHARARALEELAYGIMRVEVSIRAKKLRDDLSTQPLVPMITVDYLERLHDAEVTKLLREGLSEMNTVRTHTEVKRRLEDNFPGHTARALFGFWCQMATLGEEETRKNLTKATFYRYRKNLTSVGCAWNGTDIAVTQTAIPAGFTLSRMDPRRVLREDPQITELLSLFRHTAA